MPFVARCAHTHKLAVDDCPLKAVMHMCISRMGGKWDRLIHNNEIIAGNTQDVLLQEITVTSLLDPCICV